MRRGSRIRIAISVIAIVGNAVLLCLLVFEVFRNPPAGWEAIIPAVFGLFLLLNLLAITFAFRGARGDVPVSGASAARSPKVRLVGLGIVVLGCIGLGFWMGFDSHDQIESWRRQRAKRARFEEFVGKKAPDVVASTLEGIEWKLQDQRGKVVLIDFWAMWCAPCVAAMPEMKKIYDKYKSHRDFVMVGVSLDREKQSLVKFCEEREILWPQLLEAQKGWENSVARAFDVRAIPSVWVIDKEGNVVGVDIYGAANRANHREMPRSSRAWL